MSRTTTIAVSATRAPVLSEETANQLTHGLGWLMAVIGAGVLLSAASTGDSRQFVGCAIYVASLTMLYGASTLSHSFENQKLRNFFRLIDQICIFLLAVGSFTPFALVHLKSGVGSLLLPAMCVCVSLAVVARLCRGNQNLAVIWYVLIGWMPILAATRFIEIGKAPGLALVMAGAFCYMAGTFFLLNDTRVRYFHAVWHLFVIVGSTCHFLFLLDYVALWQA